MLCRTLQDCLETTLPLRGELYLLGDVNVRIDLLKIKSRIFMDHALQTFDLQQDVSIAPYSYTLDRFRYHYMRL